MDRRALFVLGALVLGGAGIFFLIPYLRGEFTRGVRNNNPGNIKHTSRRTWPGEIGIDEKGFAIFRTPTDGLRALAQLILEYQYLHGITTLNAFGERYAESGADDSYRYGRDLGAQLGLDPSRPADLAGYGPELMRAIIYNENGYDPYWDTTLTTAFNYQVPHYQEAIA